jgi:hypothetical protein
MPKGPSALPHPQADDAALLASRLRCSLTGTGKISSAKNPVPPELDTTQISGTIRRQINLPIPAAITEGRKQKQKQAQSLKEEYRRWLERLSTRS